MILILSLFLATLNADASPSVETAKCVRNKYTGTCSSMTPYEREYAYWRSQCELSRNCPPFGYPGYGYAPAPQPQKPVKPAPKPKRTKRRR